MRTNRRTPEEQLEMVRLCRASGLTIAEWCRREGIKSDTYYTWIERLQKRGMLEKAAPVPQKIVSQPFSPEIVRVQVEAPNQPIKYPNLPPMNKEPAPSARNEQVLEINIGEICIKATNQIDPQLLLETLRLIGGGSGVR
ncbi:MAG: transposase [Clostridia bacterium]|nr:transposase [Clostridia bacterium]